MPGNVLTYSIKYVDTAGAIFADNVLLGKIVWSAPTAANHVLLISDADGVVLYTAKAAAANDYFEFDFNGASHTLTVTTIDSGVLLIYPYMP